MNDQQPTAAEMRVMRADAARVRAQQDEIVVALPVPMPDDLAAAS